MTAPTSAAWENSVNLRLTWQATAKSKFNFFYDQHWRCQCGVTSPIIAEEAANHIHYPISDLKSVSYTVTPTNRVLIEARFGERREEYAYTPDATDFDRSFTPVIEQGGSIPGLLYRGGGISTATQPYQRTLGVSIRQPGMQWSKANLGAVAQQQKHEGNIKQRRIEAACVLYQHGPDHGIEPLAGDRARRHVDEDGAEQRQRNADAAEDEIFPCGFQRFMRAVDADHENSGECCQLNRDPHQSNVVCDEREVHREH